MKLKYLLPVTTIASIAAVVPAITSCAKQPDEPEVQDKILKGSYSWQSGASEPEKPFEYPADYKILPVGTKILFGHLWDEMAKNDNMAYYLAADYIRSWSGFEYQTNQNYEVNVELNLTKRRMTNQIKVGTSTFMNMTNVPMFIAYDSGISMLEPIGAATGGMDLMSFDNWTIEFSDGSTPITFSPDSKTEDIAYLDGVLAYGICYIHYLDNVQLI